MPIAPDKVLLRNISLNATVGLDAWSRPRLQPILLSVTASLAKPFTSAAQNDKVDSSTLNYGTLSKSIFAFANEQAATPFEPADYLNAIAQIVLAQVKDPATLHKVEVELFLPKGTKYGEGIGYSEVYDPKKSLDIPRSCEVWLKNVKIPCIIGVNDIERETAQVVVVNLRITEVGPKAKRLTTKSDDALEATTEKVLHSGAKNCITLTLSRSLEAQAQRH
jgi:dihydroneopterin aldolase